MNLHRLLYNPIFVPLFTPKATNNEKVISFLKKFSRRVGQTQLDYQLTVSGSYLLIGWNAGFAICSLNIGSLDSAKWFYIALGSIFAIHFYIQVTRLSAIQSTQEFEQYISESEAENEQIAIISPTSKSNQ